MELTKEQADKLNFVRYYSHHDDPEGDFHEGQTVTVYELMEVIEMLMVWEGPTLANFSGLNVR